MMLKAQSILSVFIFMGLSSCASVFQRSENSGYSGVSYLNPIEKYSSKRSKIEDETREDLGLYGNNLNDAQAARLSQRMSLKEAESAIPTKKERKQYYRFYSYFSSDRERLGFLGLPDFDTKERFLRSRGYYEKEKTAAPGVAEAIEAQDIVLGMTPQHVMESWGDPDAREVAGSSDRGNERWKYSKFIPQADGFEKEVRMIYFEHGRVVGWEKLH